MWHKFLGEFDFADWCDFVHFTGNLDFRFYYWEQISTDLRQVSAQYFTFCTTASFNHPIDVSINCPSKHFMREKFKGWYAAEVENKLAAGCLTRDIKVDMGIPLMHEKTLEWLLDFIISLKSNPSIIHNGWCKCGITNALENGVPSA